MRWAILLLLQIIFYTSTLGQELVFGDQSAEESIKKNTSWIYENKDETRFFLTKKRLQKIKSSSTSLVVHLLKNEVNRVITISTTKKGQKSTEWYFYNKQLIFVYDVFEYFGETKSESNWKNFKGLYGWESRYYFANEQLAFHKHKGRKEIDSDLNGNSILKDAESILKYIKQESSKVSK